MDITRIKELAAKANLGYLVFDHIGNETISIDHFDDLVYFVELIKQELGRDCVQN